MPVSAYVRNFYKKKGEKTRHAALHREILRRL